VPKTGIICQVCGVEAPTRYVEFHQNIGALVVRYHKGIKGNLCKRCIHKYFWSYTGTNLTLGWWGTVSLIMTPVFTINNVARYIGALGMQPVPPDAKPPVLGADAALKLNPLAKQLISRLNAGEPLPDLARDIARRTGLTPGQVVKYVAQLAGQRSPAARAPAFPVFSAPPPKPPDFDPIPLEPAPQKTNDETRMTNDE
jgi:hypothetical protein